LSEEVNDLEGSPDMIDITFDTAVMNLRAHLLQHDWLGEFPT
jgi:hypothetical protein